MKVVRFSSVVHVFTIPMHDECRSNEWIRRKIDFERRVFRLQHLLESVHKLHLKCVEEKRMDLSWFLFRLKTINQDGGNQEEKEEEEESESSDEDLSSDTEDEDEEENSDLEICFE